MTNEITVQNMPSMTDAQRDALKSHITADAMINEKAKAAYGPSKSWVKKDLALIVGQLMQWDMPTLKAFFESNAPGQPQRNVENTPAPAKPKTKKAKKMKKAKPESFDLDALLVGGAFDVMHPNVIAEIKTKIGDIVTKAQDAGRKAAKAAKATQGKGGFVTGFALNRTAKLKKLFDITERLPASLNIDVTLWDNSHPTPLEETYIFPATETALVMASLERGSNVFLWGDRGNGKSSLVQQIAARTGRHLVTIGFSRETEYPVLIGSRIPNESGAFEMAYGALSQAVQIPGCIIALEEITALDAEAQLALNTMMQDRRLTIPETGEVLHFAEGVAIVGLDNTDGYGDDTGHYVGTNTLNRALLDRFQRKLKITAPTVETISEIITRHTGANDETAKLCAEMIEHGRVAAERGLVSDSISLRPVLEFCRDIMAGVPADIAFDTTVQANLPSADGEEIRNHVRAHMPSNKEIARLVEGLPEETLPEIEALVQSDADATEALVSDFEESDDVDESDAAQTVTTQATIGGQAVNVTLQGNDPTPTVTAVENTPDAARLLAALEAMSDDDKRRELIAAVLDK